MKNFDEIKKMDPDKLAVFLTDMAHYEDIDYKWKSGLMPLLPFEDWGDWLDREAIVKEAEEPVDADDISEMVEHINQMETYLLTAKKAMEHYHEELALYDEIRDRLSRGEDKIDDLLMDIYHSVTAK